MKRSHHSILIFLLCIACDLPAMEIVSSTAALADIAKEKVQTWMQSKSTYAAFYSAVRTALDQNLKKQPQDSPATIAEAAAKKAGLHWPLDPVHKEGLAEYGASWNNYTSYHEVPIKTSIISPEYVMMRGGYGIRRALQEEQKAYLADAQSSESTPSPYTAFGTLVDLSGKKAAHLCIPYAPSSICPIQISPNRKYVLALSPDEKSVTLFTEGSAQEPARLLYSYPANPCKKHFWLTDTHVYSMEGKELYQDKIGVLTSEKTQARILINTFDAEIASTAVTPSLIVSSCGSSILIRGTEKKLHCITKKKDLSLLALPWQSKSTLNTITLPQSTERYDLHLLDKMGLFLAIHTSGYCGDMQNKHIIGSLKEPHNLHTFYEPSAGKCIVSPCQKYFAVTNYYTEKISLYEIHTPSNGDWGVNKLAILPAEQLIGWSDEFGTPLFAYKNNNLYAFYSNPVLAVLAQCNTGHVS